MPAYHKLVRDLIPEIIEKKGKRCSTRILEDSEYRHELHRKCQEEYHEYIAADNEKDRKEELADLLEVIYALAKVDGISLEELERVRSAKAKERGGFERKILLLEVEE